MDILTEDFYNRDTLAVARDLLGRHIVRRAEGRELICRITETEAYIGRSDKACHAYGYKRTKRSETLFSAPGTAYIYLIYGMYWMLNFVTGEKDNPQAVLIRGLETVSGPGRVGRKLALNRSFYGEELPSPRIWLEDAQEQVQYKTTPRIGVDYAGEWAKKEWRFVLLKV